MLHLCAMLCCLCKKIDEKPRSFFRARKHTFFALCSTTHLPTHTFFALRTQLPDGDFLVMWHSNTPPNTPASSSAAMGDVFLKPEQLRKKIRTHTIHKPTSTQALWSCSYPPPSSSSSAQLSQFLDDSFARAGQTQTSFSPSPHGVSDDGILAVRRAWF